MDRTLEGRNVAILVTNGFEQVELTSPRDALREAGARTHIVAPESGQVRGWQHTDWGEAVDVDVMLQDARPEDYDLLLLPGGVINPDKLRLNGDAVDFVRAFARQQKPIASICHGPWTLIEAGLVSGRRMTSYWSIETDLKNAGALWVDEPVVEDGGLVTSRSPDDLKLFNEKVVQVLSEGRQAHHQAA